MARPKLPTAIKEAKGTLRKSRTNALEPVLPKSAPTAPAELTKIEKRYFNEVCQLMNEMHTLTVSDVYVIKSLARALARSDAFAKTLEAYGSTSFPNATGGGARAYPEVANLHDNERLVIQLLGKCGLTAADRQSVNAIPAPDEPASDDTDILFE